MNLGGGSGVGAEIAKSFVRSGSKAVVLLGRRASILNAAKKDLEALGTSKILTYAVDVVDEEALNNAFAATEQAVGKVDIVVACAGYLPDVVPAAVADIGDWWKAFEVNVLGLALTFRAWMPHKSLDNGTPSFIYVNAGELSENAPVLDRHMLTANVLVRQLAHILPQSQACLAILPRRRPQRV
jgi:NADP-dependent 3-hydroxy acid dehydrogenase YdfG